MRHFRMLMGILILVPVSLHGEPPEPQQNSGTKLHRVFSDDFSKDSLSDYQTKGKVAWETGLLKLPAGASLSRPVELGSRVVVRAELQFPTLTKDGQQSLTMLRIELDGATPCYAAWQQTRKDGKTSSRLIILDTVPKDGKDTLQVVRSLAADAPLKSAEWSVDYRHGLLRIGRAHENVLAVYIENGPATVGGFSWFAPQSEIQLRRLAVDGLNRPAPLTESQQKSAAEATQKNTQLLQLYGQGKYVEAAELGETVLGLRRKVLGVEHPDYATSLNNLAAMYSDLGEYAKSEPLFLEARDIRKRVQGAEHPDYATILNNLARLYFRHGEHGKAEPLYVEALDAQKRVLGVEHPSYATSLGNLALLNKSQGEYAKAEPLYLEARDIFKRVLGVQHPDYAMSLNALAVLYHLQGQYAKAEPLYLESSDIFKRVLGGEHPEYARSLNYLARLYHVQDKYAQAEPLYRESLKLSRDLIERNAVGQSQSTQLKYAATLRSRLDSLLSHGLASPTAESGELYDEILSWKGMTLVRQRKYRLAGEDARTRPILEALTATSRQMTAVLRKTSTPDTQKAWRQRLAELTEKRDRLEAELAAASPEIQQASERLTTQDLLETLPEDTVLVDFLSFNFWQRVPNEDYHVLEGRRHFLASILRKGRPVEFVNLGPEADINQAVRQWRTAFLSRNPNDTARVKPAGRKLRQQIWEPLLPHLQGAKTVILCPDRALGRVAFVTLPGREKSSYLIEDHRLACVPVPQLLPALFRKVSAEQRPAGDALLIGDVDYSADKEQQAAPKKKKRRRGSEELFRDVAFGPLDETAGEIAAIRDLFFELFDAEPNAVKTLRKQQATESAFRQYAGQYETLHIATHGFFADASKKSAEHSATEDNRAGSRSGLFGQNDNALTHVRGFHPGMLSGLALAGANHAPEAAGDDDGILTADEISFLRLEGVDLVVLSACETGLGEVAGGEGLLGVQRAFQVSGARSVLASLWKVDDVATRRLMDRFYRNLWDKEMTRLDALREAQLWMLKNPGSIRGSLVRLKKPPQETSPKTKDTTGRTSPRFWAAFTLSGDWR